MALDAAAVDALQAQQPPTDWSRFDSQAQDQAAQLNNPRFAMDSKLHVRFYSQPQYMPDKSQEANRPIYEDTIYVEIMMPGEKNSIIQRPAFSMRDDLRFPQHFAQYKAGNEQIVGTPLKLLPFLSPAQIEELAYFKVRTVEQLADLADSVSFMGSQELKQKARQYLTSIHSGERLAEENKDLKTRMAALEAMLEKMTAPKAEAKK